MNIFNNIGIVGIVSCVGISNVNGRNFRPDSLQLYNAMKDTEKFVEKNKKSEIQEINDICYKISVQMVEENRITTITALDSHSGEQIGKTTFKKSKKAFGKRTKGIGKQLNTFLTQTVDTKCHKYLNIVKDNSASLDDRKAAMKQLGELYSSPSISPETKQEIKDFVQSMYREYTIESNIASFGLTQDNARSALDSAIPHGKFPDIITDPNNPYLDGLTKVENQNCGGYGSYYCESMLKHQSMDMLLLNDGFIENHRPQTPDEFLEEKTIMLKNIDSQSLETLKESLSQVRKRTEFIKNDRFTELGQMINSCPTEVMGCMFEHSVDAVPVAQRMGRLNPVRETLEKLETKINNAIVSRESGEATP
jgi:hypothetical protein